MDADLTVEVANGVAVLTLNRPQRRNAYTAEMGRLLGDAYTACDADVICAMPAKTSAPGCRLCFAEQPLRR